MNQANMSSRTLNTLRGSARRVSVAILIAGTATWVASCSAEERTAAPLTLQTQQAPVADVRVNAWITPATRPANTAAAPAVLELMPVSSAPLPARAVPSAVVAEPSEVEDFQAM